MKKFSKLRYVLAYGGGNNKAYTNSKDKISLFIANIIFSISWFSIGRQPKLKIDFISSKLLVQIKFPDHG